MEKRIIFPNWNRPIAGVGLETYIKRAETVICPEECDDCQYRNRYCRFTTLRDSCARIHNPCLRVYDSPACCTSKVRYVDCLGNIEYPRKCCHEFREADYCPSKRICVDCKRKSIRDFDKKYSMSCHKGYCVECERKCSKEIKKSSCESIRTSRVYCPDCHRIQSAGCYKVYCTDCQKKIYWTGCHKIPSRVYCNDCQPKHSKVYCSDYHRTVSRESLSCCPEVKRRISCESQKELCLAGRSPCYSGGCHRCPTVVTCKSTADYCEDSDSNCDCAEPCVASRHCYYPCNPPGYSDRIYYLPTCPEFRARNHRLSFVDDPPYCDMSDFIGGVHYSKVQRLTGPSFRPIAFPPPDKT